MGERLVVFCRGRPRKVIEQCCSFMLIYKLKSEDSCVTGIDPHYTYIKLDSLIYPQFLTTPFVQRRGDTFEISTVQENNF